MTAGLKKLQREMDVYEYPTSAIQQNGGIPQNTSYVYVSSTFLNGLVNYGSNHVGFLVARYGLRDPKTGETLIDSNSPNAVEAYTEFARQQSEEIHFQANGDDWLILYETDYSFMFLWYDLDSSDCMIERWSKESCADLEIKTLEQFIEERIALWREQSGEYCARGFGRQILVRAPNKLRGWIRG